MSDRRAENDKLAFLGDPRLRAALSSVIYKERQQAQAAINQWRLQAEAAQAESARLRKALQEQLGIGSPEEGGPRSSPDHPPLHAHHSIAVGSSAYFTTCINPRLTVKKN